MKNKIIRNNRTFDNLRGFIDYLEFIKNYFSLDELKSFVEVGAFIGESTSIIADHFPDTKIIAIDIWQNDFDENDAICEFDFRVAEDMFNKNTLYNKNVVTIKDYSVNAVHNFEDNSIDVIYIDANHSYEYCLIDILLWYPKIKAGGILSGHDYIEESYTGVIKALDDLHIEPLRIFDDTSWLYIK